MLCNHAAWLTSLPVLLICRENISYYHCVCSEQLYAITHTACLLKGSNKDSQREWAA